jgi:hypothetical protein
MAIKKPANTKQLNSAARGNRSIFPANIIPMFAIPVYNH